MDWMAQEQERGITITSAATTAFVARPSGSTLSIRPGTWTLPSRSSGACASSTARSPSSTRSPASSRSPRPSGARPTSTRSRGSRSSTRWTAPARTSSPPCSRCATASARTRCRSRSRSAQEDNFRGVVDLVEMKAIVYKDDLGQEFEIGGDPGRARRAGARVPPPADRRDLALRRRGARGVPRGRELGHGRPDPARASRGDARRRDHAGAARLARSRTRACSRCSTRSSTTCRARSTCPPIQGLDPKTEAETRAPGVARRAVLGARVQGHVRPVRRQAHLLPRLQRQAQGRRPRAQHDDRQDRADRPHPPDAREPPRGARGDRRRRDRRGRRPQVDDDRRHARGRDRADRARVDDLPGAR